MRKLFSLMLVVLGAAALVSCSKDDDVLREGEGEITFVTEMEGCLYIETFNAGDRITIDWGDGSKKEYVSERDGFEDITEIEFIYGIYPYHTYAGKSSHRVTVKGKIKGVMHCYSGSLEMAYRFIDLGLLISIGGPVTFKNAKESKRIAAELDLKYLLVETDCPYLAPVPYRGSRNESSYVHLVVEEIAHLKNIPSKEVENRTEQNAVELFGLEEIQV